MFQIGSGPKKQARTVAERLLDCHGRIRENAELAVTLAGAGDRPEAEIREAADKVARYFEQALPRHVADENDTIAPRLRGREPELDRALDAMEAEHAAHEEGVAAVIAMCRQLAGDPAALPGLSRLHPIATALRDDLAAHLEAEERLILPAIDRLIDAGEQAAMIEEMKARRDR